MTYRNATCGRRSKNSQGQVDYHELKVAMRALGFDVKKQEVPRLKFVLL